VVITDAELPDGLSLVDGSLTAKFDKINPGSSKKVSYVVVATKGDAPIMLNNAKVSYKSEADASEATTGTSTFTGFYVITPTQEIIRHALTVVRGAAGGRRSAASPRLASPRLPCRHPPPAPAAVRAAAGRRPAGRPAAD
jgi:hypothetical protein